MKGVIVNQPLRVLCDISQNTGKVLALQNSSRDTQVVKNAVGQSLGIQVSRHLGPLDDGLHLDFKAIMALKYNNLGNKVHIFSKAVQAHTTTDKLQLKCIKA